MYFSPHLLHVNKFYLKILKVIVLQTTVIKGWVKGMFDLLDLKIFQWNTRESGFTDIS